LPDLDLLDDFDLPPAPPALDLDTLERTYFKTGDIEPYEVRALIAELRTLRNAHVRAASNGHVEGGFEVECFGHPGRKLMVRRRARRHWCDDCRANGEPAAQRQRDYRARKHEEDMP
jgi:hypothetical protein